MMRSGLMRRAFTTNSRMVTSPVPSALGARASKRTTWGCSSNFNSAASSMVMTRSSWEIWQERAFKSVVLPLPVPPETAMERRDPTAQMRNCSTVSSNEPLAFSSASVMTRRVKARMVSSGPLRESGGSTALTRWPWGKRALAMGDDSSTRRPKGPKMRSMSARTCSSLSKLTLARERRPSRSMYTLSVPLTMISVTVSSAIRSSSGPSPNTVLISPSTKSRNTAGASAFHGSRVESLRQAARISLRARSGLSTAMSATLSRGTSSPTAVRKDSSPVATRSSSCCSRASSATRTHSRRDISSPPYDASLAKAPSRRLARPLRLRCLPRNLASALGAKLMRARGACTPALAG